MGIRWLLPGLKVYYLPFPTIASSATLPNYFTFLPYFRTIILREEIQLIHGHAGLSSLAQEGILHAHHVGVRTVFTDHSLFGFDDAASILTNKLLEAALRNVDAAICVSHTGYAGRALGLREPTHKIYRRENTVLRSRMHPSIVHVIPNALVADQFRPSSTPPPRDTSEITAQKVCISYAKAVPVTVVVVSRMAYRKGVDLLIATAPRICALFPNVRFLIGTPHLFDKYSESE